MIEIEKKFLVRDGWEKEAVSSTRIAQGYLCSGQGCSVRIRIRGGKGFITIKGPGSASGMSRFEWEKEIPADEAQQLLGLVRTGLVDKTRHLIPCADGIHTWEVDEFHGDNEGLVVAEIELESEDAAFDRPAWLAEEVTGQREYYNSSLAQLPYKYWKKG